MLTFPQAGKKSSDSEVLVGTNAEGKYFCRVLSHSAFVQEIYAQREKTRMIDSLDEAEFLPGVNKSLPLF